MRQLIFELVFTSLIFLFVGSGVSTLKDNLNKNDHLGSAVCLAAFLAMWGLSYHVFEEFLPFYLSFAAMMVSPVVGTMVFEDIASGSIKFGF